MLMKKLWQSGWGLTALVLLGAVALITALNM